MIGKIRLSVWNNRFRYDMEFKRSVTIITGQSGIGKTTFVNMINDRLTVGAESGVELDASIPEEQICDKE